MVPNTPARDMKLIIEELIEIDIICKEARYSIGTAARLKKISDEIHIHARLINECCY